MKGTLVEKNGAWWTITKSNPSQKVLSVFSASRPDVYICKHDGHMPAGEFVVDFDSSGKGIERLRPSTAPPTTRKTTRRTTTRMPLRNDDEETTSTTTTEFQSTQSTTTTTSEFSTIDFGHLTSRTSSSTSSSSQAKGRRNFKYFSFTRSEKPLLKEQHLHQRLFVEEFL